MKTGTIALLALAVLAAVGGLSAYIWLSMDDVAISWMGLLAMAVGVVFSLALGIGLMSLVYFSNKRGYDDEAGHW
jgi:1,4-dihydroxy-2-naphthoate octaprenyltransferase